MPENNNNNDLEPHAQQPNLLLLAERQRQMLKRLNDFEKKQKEMETMMNRFVGGTALLVAVGVFIGWLFSISSGIQTFFQHK
jgi:hypothetical protein